MPVLVSNTGAFFPPQFLLLCVGYFPLSLPKIPLKKHFICAGKARVNEEPCTYVLIIVLLYLSIGVLAAATHSQFPLRDVHS